MPSTKETARKNRKNRIRAKISGTALRPRLVVFRSLTHTYAQIIDDENSKIITQSSDLKLKDKGTKIEKAKKVGEELAKKAIEAKVKEVVFDRNGYKYHGRVKAVAESAREGGLKF
ncbi:50S ribosomal protein L18 [Patescibacteria group bacterium]|nr:50S ribosomal protein L18 [Patescibacteria group bacterium]